MAQKKETKKSAKTETSKPESSKKVVKKAPAKKAAEASVEEEPAAVSPAATAPTQTVEEILAELNPFVKKQYQRLLDLRDELMDAMYGMQQETLRSASDSGEASGSGEHTGDAGSDAYDREFALNLLAKEQDSLQEIEAAIKRVESGRYGICELSGEKIPRLRLEAIPFARLTVEKQAEWEKEHGTRRFRPRDEYGFMADRE